MLAELSYDGQNDASDRRNNTFEIDDRNVPSKNDYMNHGFARQNYQSHFRGCDGYNNPNLTIFARQTNSSGMNYNDFCVMHLRDDSSMAVRPVHNAYQPRMYDDENRRNEPRRYL